MESGGGKSRAKNTLKKRGNARSGKYQLARTKKESGERSGKQLTQNGKGKRWGEGGRKRALQD